MPRLEITQEIIDYYDLEFDENDPGATQPIDLCDGCYWLIHPHAYTNDHPPYDLEDYDCHACGERLTAEDDPPL